MLLKRIGFVSIILAVISSIYLVPERAYLLPIILVGSFIAIVLLWCLVGAFFTLFIDMNKEYNTNSPFYRYFTDRIVESLQQLMNIKLHVKGKEILPKEKFMLVCNHRSAMDPILTMDALKEYKMGFVAKGGIYKIPVIRRLMHRCFCPKLKKGDIKEEAKTIIRASKLVKSQEASIGIYPEGTRNRTEAPLLPFMNGSFKIAKKADSAIVVAVIKNAENIAKNTPFKRTHVYLEFVSVISKETVEEKNTAELSEIARTIIEEKLLTCD